MAYGYIVKNNKKSKWYVLIDMFGGASAYHFNTKREALADMKEDHFSLDGDRVESNKRNMVLVRERTWREKDDELRTFNTIVTERDELIRFNAKSGVMFEKKEVIRCFQLYDEWQAIWSRDKANLTKWSMINNNEVWEREDE